MADSDRRNRNGYYDDYGDNYGSSSRRRKSYSDGDEEYPVTARYAPYFNNYGDGTEDSTEYEDIYSHSNHSSDRRRTDNTRRHKKKKHSFKRGCSFFLVILILLAGVLGVALYAFLDCVNYAEIDTSNGYLSDSQADTAQELISDRRVLNIMLFGVDEDSSGYGRSDTMLLLSIDKRHKKLKMTSFQRDTFVYVPDPDGSYSTKLTNAFSYGGVELAVNTIEANYGIQIDRYATVNFETFKSIVDILGGVELYLTADEIAYINAQIAYNNQSEYLYASEGTVNLNGQQALWYARNRGGYYSGMSFSGNDWDRTERQRKFLSAVIDDVKSANIAELLSIVSEAGPYVTTNLTKTELMSLVISLPAYLRYTEEQCSMPSEGTWGYEENFAGSVIYVYDWDTARSDLAEFIYEASAQN